MSSFIFVTISMRGGGTERVISVLANRMVDMGHKVTIVMIADPTIEYDLDKRVVTVCVSKATGGSLIGRIKRICNMRKVFAQDKTAKIISMGTVANLFTIVASIGLSNPISISERNDPNRLNHRPIKKHEVWIRNILYRRADRVVLQTPDVAEIFPMAIQRKSVVIANPIPDDLPEPIAYENREKTVIAAGRFIPSKNYKMLIDVFSEFNKCFPEYQLLIFGKGDTEPEIRKQIEGLEMQEKILLCGFSDNLYEELGRGGMYVSTSDSEGLSNSLLEALAMGIPTIATDCPVGGTRMCIRDGINGYMIPVRDYEALLQKMTALASDKELGKRFAKEAVRIREDFSAKTITKQWME